MSSVNEHKYWPEATTCGAIHLQMMLAADDIIRDAFVLPQAA